jgi:uncharacterized LabA/DUF88 family protein
MESAENNYAFIDGQNLNLGIRALGWQLNYRKFRIYLREKYGATRAYLFVGFLPKYQKLYQHLEDAGFTLIFKTTVPDSNGNVKGNIDADMVLKSMIEFFNYDKALIVSNDGDFHSLVDHLSMNNKLRLVLSPNKKYCSFLLRRAAKEKMQFMDDLRAMLEYI